MKYKKKTEITIRSSAAEYLTFITASGEGGVETVYADENVWLSQKMMATLYNVNVRTVNEHLKKIFSDNELNENSVIRKFYQKITDIYATSIDYDITSTATKRFFATVQNKLHWALWLLRNLRVTPLSRLLDCGFRVRHNSHLKYL